MTVEVRVADRVAVVTLKRPQAMNALDPESYAALRKALERLAHDDDILVGIVTGEGERAFCAGSDLKKTSDPIDLFAGLEVEKPLVAAVNGVALGGGLEIALFCDIRIASTNARFGLPEVRVGSMPGLGGTQRLPRTIGLSDAMRMLMTGEQIDAAEALRIGLVSRVVEGRELMGAAVAIADRIKANAPLAVRAVKRVVYEGLDAPLADALRLERRAFDALRGTEDRLEGRKAFAEKRPPVYKGK